MCRQAASVVGDEATHEVAALGADVRADVVQHHAAQQGGADGGDAHRKQPAEAGADGDHLVQMQCGTEVQHVAQARLGGVAGNIGAAAGGAASGIVGCHHAAAGAERGGKFSKVVAGADQAGQAQQRDVRVAGVPFVHRERQAVPGGEEVD
jgi:hypothetical protein